MKFYDEVRNRLGHRMQGFDLIFDYLKQIQNPLIVETGCAREEDNYGGDGQSSLLFDKYINEYGGEFFTVDISEQSVDYCTSKMTSSNSHVILNDSIAYLKQLNTQLQDQNRKIDFLYLDSFDAPKDKPEVVFASAVHHLYEYTTILPSLRSGTLIGVDDNWFEWRNGVQVMAGKGQFVCDYMNKTNNPLIYNGYQLFWKQQ
jgi:hypothetical protein